MLSTGQGPEQTEPIGSRLHPLLASLSLQAYTLHYSSSECLDDEYFIHLQTLSPLGSWNNVIPQPRSRGQSLSCPWTPPLPNLCLSTPSFFPVRPFGSGNTVANGADLTLVLTFLKFGFLWSLVQAVLAGSPGCYTTFFQLKACQSRTGRSPWC